MLLQKRIAFLLCAMIMCLSQYSYSKTTLQDTIPQFNAEVFKDSLRKLESKKFVGLFLYKYKEHPKKAPVCLNYIENEMLQSEDLLKQFWGNYGLAHWHHDQMDLKKSLTLVDKLYEIATEMKNEDLILSSLINKANFYYEFGDYENSMEYSLRAMDLLKNTDNIIRELAVMYNISLIKLQTNDNLGAVELLKKMVVIIHSGVAGELTNFKTNVYIALIKGFIELENYNEAKVYCEKVISLSKNNNDRESKFYGLSFLGTIERLEKNYENAHQLLDESLEIAKEVQAVAQEIPLIYFEKGEVFYDQKNYKEAIKMLLKADALMQQNNLDFIKLEETYALLAKSYNELGDVENSVKFYEKANEAYKKNDKRQGRISVDIIKKYDLNSLKKELNQAEQKTQKTRTILYISISLGLFIVIGLVYFYKKREKDNQQKFTALLQSLEEEKQKSKGIAQKEVFMKEPLKENVSIKKNSKEVASKEVEIIDGTKAKLLKKLQNFEEKELYLSKNSSLNEVAKKLKTNTSYLSKLVNAHKGKSFTAYITDLRVNYAIRRLKEDRKFRSYTIDSIAREIGFNRSESFSRAFKNKTGLYPSYYVKNLDSQNIV